MEFLLRTVARMASAGVSARDEPGSDGTVHGAGCRGMLLCSVIFDPYCLLRSCYGAHAARTTGFVI